MSRFHVGLSIAIVLTCVALPQFASADEPVPNLTVSVVTSNSQFADVEANLKHFETLVVEAAGRGARLVCFPELALTSYSNHPSVLKAAQSVPGEATRRLEAMAAKNNVYLSVGMAERDGDKHHIAQVVIGPDGYLGKYRKCFPTTNEQACGFVPGHEYPTWDIDGFRFGVLICADGRQESTIQAMRQEGVDVIHHPHGNYVGTLGRTAEEWTRSKMVYFVPRAITARAYVLINNSAGDVVEPGGVRHFGSGGLVLDPLGQAVARTTATDRAERMIITTLVHPLRLIPLGELRILSANDPAVKQRAAAGTH